LLGDPFGFDYRLRDPRSESFHQIANFAFFDRNFSDYGLHYFNMQVDFYFQLLRRFHPELLSETLRASVRNFIKATNLDTYECLSRIFDHVSVADPADAAKSLAFSREMRERIDERSRELLATGERIIAWLEATYEARDRGPVPPPEAPGPLARSGAAVPSRPGSGWNSPFDPLGLTPVPIPYEVWSARRAAEREGREEDAERAAGTGSGATGRNA
jgi:hypothetical protein